MSNVVLAVDMLVGFMEPGHNLYCGDGSRGIIPNIQRLIEPEQYLGQNEMAGRADRQILGDPFNESKDDGVKNRHGGRFCDSECGYENGYGSLGSGRTDSVDSASQGIRSRTASPADSIGPPLAASRCCMNQRNPPA